MMHGHIVMHTHKLRHLCVYIMCLNSTWQVSPKTIHWMHEWVNAPYSWAWLRKHINKSIQQLAPRKGQQERYRDNDAGSWELVIKASSAIKYPVWLEVLGTLVTFWCLSSARVAIAWCKVVTRKGERFIKASHIQQPWDFMNRRNWISWDVCENWSERFLETDPNVRLNVSGFVMGQVDISLDPGPGCELGGIIGWRTKQGRRGLGHGAEKGSLA